MKFKVAAGFIFTALFLATSAGVRDFAIKKFGIDQGFGGTFIYSIVQDENGFLWVGSDDGLYQFDGKTMVNLNKKDTTMGGQVTASTIAKDGHLFLGYAKGGVSIVEHGRYRKIMSEERVPNKVVRLYQDAAEVIWGLTQNRGIIKIENDTAIHMQPDALVGNIAFDLIKHEDILYVGTNDGLLKLKVNGDGTITSNGFVAGSEGMAITTMYEDPNEDEILWVGSEEGLHYIAHGNNESLTVVAGLEEVRVSAIVRDQLETLWVGTASSGLVEIQLKANKSHKITNFNKENGFAANQINSLYVDRENEIWAGTFGNGLVQLNRALFHHYELKKSAEIEGVNEIFQVDENLYYLATNTGLVKAYNAAGKDSLTFELVSQTRKYDVKGLLVSEDVIWLGTGNEGLVRYDIKRGAFKKIVLNPVDPGLSHLVRYLAFGNDGNLWVSIAGNGVYNIRHDGSLIQHFNTRNGFYHNEIFAILPDAGGNVWFGAHAVGLALLRENKELEFLTRDEIFPGRDINSISQDDQGKVWIATAGAGLFGFDGEEFEQFDESTGLLSKFCNAVEVDNAGQIWVGHRQGLSLIQPEYGLVRRFDHPNELGETESVVNSVAKDDQGNVWFGNPYGVTKVILPHIQHRIEERATHIQDVRLFFNQVDLLKYSEQTKLDNILPNDLTFHHKQNHLTFDCISINLRNPEAIYYQYKLDGYDKEWSPVTTDNKATFTNLDPGKYTFKVRESDHPELWKDNFKSIDFEIESPYWKTWWFYLIQISVMLSLFALTYMISTKIKNHFVIRLMVYVSLFIVFEYIHTEMEPFIESLAGDAPIFQVGINLVLALILLPIEIKLSRYLRHRETNKKVIAEPVN